MPLLKKYHQAVPTTTVHEDARNPLKYARGMVTAETGKSTMVKMLHKIPKECNWGTTYPLIAIRQTAR
jgi:hypothetical protein